MKFKIALPNSLVNHDYFLQINYYLHIVVEAEEQYIVVRMPETFTLIPEMYNIQGSCEQCGDQVI